MEGRREPDRFSASAPPERYSPKRQTEAHQEANSLNPSAFLVLEQERNDQWPVLKTTSKPLGTVSDRDSRSSTSSELDAPSTGGESTLTSSHKSNPDLPLEECRGGAPDESILTFQGTQLNC